MTINLAEAASNAILDVLGALMNGGRIILRSEKQSVLAVLKLSNPAAAKAAGGTLIFNKIGKETRAPSSGLATLGQIVAADGREVFSCDVGTENSHAVIKLASTSISQDSGVEILAFELRMP